MKLRRRKPVGRQRQPQRSEAPVAYRLDRSEDNPNTGRKLQRQAADAGRNLIRRFGLIILCAAAVFSATNVLTLSGNASIAPLDGVDSIFLRDQAIYQAAANKYLAGSIWNRNKITADTKGLSRALQAEFPELASVSVTIPLLAHRPLIYVQPSQPALLLQTSNGSYVVDTTGKALLRAEQAKLPKLPVVTDQSGLQIKLNRQALPADQVAFITQVVAQLAAKQLVVSGMTLPSAASQLDVQIAGQPFIIKFNLQANTPREQAGTFLATFGQLQRSNQVPAKYVDVRVPGRAYYQ